MSTTPHQEWLTLARVVKPQGRRGEVLADLLTDFPEQFSHSALQLVDSKGLLTPATVEEHWLPVGRNAGRIVLKIRGTDSITDAEKLTGHSLQIPKDQRLTLDAETYYVNDLIGCTLADADRDLGTVEDLHFPQDPNGKRIADAAAIFVVIRPNGDEVMIPFANEFVRRISIEEKRIEMNLPHGLVEMNG